MKQLQSILTDLDNKAITKYQAYDLILVLFDVVGQSEQLVCEHKYQDNVCDWRGVRKCIICGQMEKAN